MKDFDALQRQIFANCPLVKYDNTIQIEEVGIEDTVSNERINMRLNVQFLKEAWCIGDLDSAPHRRTLQSILNQQKANLKNKCADATIWIQNDSDKWELHIFELKKTVTRSGKDNRWSIIKKQFVGAYRVCKMLAVALDIDFSRVVFYTVYINDDALATQKPSKDALDDEPAESFPDPDMLEWVSGTCQLGDDGWFNNYTDREYPHVKIRLHSSNNIDFLETYSLT